MVDIQRFEVKLVEGGEFLEKAQILRRKVFFKDTGRDEDKFDKSCKHVVVIEKSSQDVIGTYRLLLKSASEKNAGFYSETKFDLKNIKENCRGELLEMGRACVDEGYRKYLIINLMWKAIISCTQRYKVKYIFGCTSIENPTPLNIGKIIRFFKAECFSPAEFRVYPLPEESYPYVKTIKDYDKKQIKQLLPSLIKGYLKMGALTCGEPVWNRIFDTAVFFMLLDIKNINAAYVKRLYAKNG